jgi:hypothetical protein
MNLTGLFKIKQQIKNTTALGLEIETIVKVTDLSIAEIEKLI